MNEPSAGRTTPAWTHLPAAALMVPLMHELLKPGVGLIRSSPRYAVGGQPALGFGSVAAALVDPRGTNLSINAEGRPDVPLARGGVYDVLDHARQRIGLVAVNIAPVAGRTDPQDQAVWGEWMGASVDW